MVWTKAAYSERLDENITSLIVRIRRGTYHPQAARITEIPKEDGSKRPLALSCIEDKLVQLAVSDILSSVYEPLFLPCSYGFRPGLNCHAALKACNSKRSATGMARWWKSTSESISTQFHILN